MKYSVLSFLIATSLSLTSFASQAAAPLCSRLFLGTGLSGKYEEYKILKQGRQMVRAIKNGNRSLEEWVASYHLHKFGSRLPLRDYLRLSEGQRQEKLFTRMLQEKYALGGTQELQSTLAMRLEQGTIDKAFRTLFEFRRSKLGQLMRLPLDLPVMSDRAVSKETVQKWMFEGLDPHRTEVEAYLKQQGYVEGYNHFRSAWQKGALVFLFMVAYDEVNDRYEDYERKVKEKVKNALEEQLDIAEMDGVLQVYAEKAFQTMLKNFREKYKEEPTAEEFQEMRILAYKEYGITP